MEPTNPMSIPRQRSLSPFLHRLDPKEETAVYAYIYLFTPLNQSINPSIHISISSLSPLYLFIHFLLSPPPCPSLSPPCFLSRTLMLPSTPSFLSLLFVNVLLILCVDFSCNIHIACFLIFFNLFIILFLHPQAEVLASYRPKINVISLIPDLRRAEDMTTEAIAYFKSTRHMILYYEDIVNNHSVNSPHLEHSWNY